MLALTGRAQETLLCLRVCVCVCDGFGVCWRREELECEEGQAGVPERRRGQHGEVLGVQSVNRKWGEISRGTAGKEKKKGGLTAH